MLPEEEEREYLPTQVVAEYLASSSGPDLDGTIFNSSQTGGDGSNLVLFNRACAVERYTVPVGTSVKVLLPGPAIGDDSFHDRSVSVFEEVPKEAASQSEAKGDVPSLSTAPYEEGQSLAPQSTGDPTMRLDVKSVVVLEVEGTEYVYNELSVDRLQIPKDRDYDDANWPF